MNNLFFIIIFTVENGKLLAGVTYEIPRALVSEVLLSNLTEKYFRAERKRGKNEIKTLKAEDEKKMLCSTSKLQNFEAKSINSLYLHQSCFLKRLSK
jgi:hypothetical protein